MRIIINSFKVLLGLAALLAGLHIACWGVEHPLVRFVQVQGDSMEPTLLSGDRLLFVRRPWKLGSIVLVDVGEAGPVVKRVLKLVNKRICLCGDNKKISEVYWVNPEQIQCVMLCRVSLPVSLAAATASQDQESSGNQHRARDNYWQLVRHRLAAAHNPRPTKRSIPSQSSAR